MNDAIPSWKSSVAMTALLIAGMASIAAGSSSSSASRALAIVCCSASGAHCNSSRGQLDRPVPLPAGLDDLLHEPDAQRLVGGELVGPQEVVHRVAPSGALHVAHRRAAERREAALGLELAEPGVGRGHDDVAGQRDLDPDREGDALHRGHQRLGQPALQPERVDRVARRRAGVARRRPKNSGISSPAVVWSPAKVSTPTNSSGSSSRRV